MPAFVYSAKFLSETPPTAAIIISAGSTARIALIPGVLIRLLFLPLYRPRRAQSRREAFRGLIGVLFG